MDLKMRLKALWWSAVWQDDIFQAIIKLPSDKLRMLLELHIELRRRACWRLQSLLLGL